MSKSNKHNHQNQEDEIFVPRRKVSKEEIRKLKRLKNAIRSKNMSDIMDLDEDLS